MAIASGDIKFRLSGGSANAAVASSLGGFMSLNTSITDNTANNLWDDVTGAEASQGDTEYRCFFMRMSHATLNWTSVKAWISQTTVAAGDLINFGKEDSPAKVGKSYWVQSVTNESTAPANVSFVHSTTKATADSWGTIEPISVVAVWVERKVTAGASAQTNNYWGFKVEGDTAA